MDQHSAHIFLNFETPHRVLTVSSQFEDLFGFQAEEVKRSLRYLTGPKTDTAEFESLVSSCSKGNRSEKIMTFYRKDGHDVQCVLQMSPAQHNGRPAIRADFNPDRANCERHEIASCTAISEERPGLKSMRAPGPQRSVSVSDSGWLDRPEAISRNFEALDPAVVLHMKAVQRAAKAGQRKPHRQASQDF